MKHYQVYDLERSRAFFQWLWEVSIWWFLWRVTVYKMTRCISQWKIQIMSVIKSTAATTVSASRQRPWRGLKSQQWSSEERVRNFLSSIFKAAAFVLSTLALVQTLRKQREDSRWFWWALALDQLLSEQVSGLSITSFKPILTEHYGFEQWCRCCS